MKRRQLFKILAGCTISIFLAVGYVQAFYLDADQNVEIKGKVQSRFSVSTEDTEGFTNPEVDSGSFVQHRNLAYIELNHDLKNIDWNGIDLKYRLLGRFMYEGAYEYGDNALKDSRDRFPSIIDDFRKDADLWEGYVDVVKGPFFLRIGKQTLAWGETDLFRLLDNVNPLDNTYGGLFEDLDDRRLPLKMLRANYNFGSVGPISSFTLEGYFVPGFMENEVSPVAPFGTRYSFPLADFEKDFGIPTLTFKPDKNISNSRYGIRHSGVLFDVNYTIAHMRTFGDLPGARLVPDPTNAIGGANFEYVYDTLDITGISLNFYESHSDMIIRSETAWFWNEDVFIPEINVLPAFAGVAGSITEKSFLRFMIGFDKFMWIRALNEKQTFFISGQYFASWADDHDDRMSQPAQKQFPDPLTFPKAKELEQQFTLAMSTSYLSGKMAPQLSIAYDVRGAWFFQPQVNLIFEPFRVLLQYNRIEGERTNFGLLRDIDQFSVNITYLF